jgi:plastocyanin
MRFFATATAFLASVAAVSAGPLRRQSQPTGNTIKVTVGGNGSLTYSPTNVTANLGDTIAFEL